MQVDRRTGTGILIAYFALLPGADRRQSNKQGKLASKVITFKLKSRSDTHCDIASLHGGRQHGIQLLINFAVGPKLQKCQVVLLTALDYSSFVALNSSCTLTYM